MGGPFKFQSYAEYTEHFILVPKDQAQCYDSVLSYDNIEIEPLPVSA